MFFVPHVYAKYTFGPSKSFRLHFIPHVSKPDKFRTKPEYKRKPASFERFSFTALATSSSSSFSFSVWWTFCQVVGVLACEALFLNTCRHNRRRGGPRSQPSCSCKHLQSWPRRTPERVHITVHTSEQADGMRIRSSFPRGVTLLACVRPPLLDARNSPGGTDVAMNSRRPASP